MELLDMSGFIDRISYRDYDTLVHTSELDRLFKIGLWAKASNWKSPLERLSVLICCGGGGLFFSFFFSFFLQGTISKTFSLYPTISPPFFFTIFLPPCGEIHYEAGPFFFILPQWRSERRDRLSRIDNEQGDRHLGEKKGQKAENRETGRERKKGKETEKGTEKPRK